MLKQKETKTAYILAKIKTRGFVEAKNINQLAKDFPLPDDSFEWIFNISSSYFGVNKPVKKMWFDDILKAWRISTRSNIKNYENEIEKFLEWIKPYIEKGSGERNMYAIVIYEEASEPTIYYKKLNFNMKKYIAVISKDFGVVFPDFDGIVSIGKDLNDAINMAEKALELYVKGMREHGEELPEPKTLEQVKKEYHKNVFKYQPIFIK